MKKILPFILSFLVLQSAYALEQNYPAACPSVGALASVGVNDTGLFTKDFWIVKMKQHDYGTPQLWSFSFFGNMKTSEEAVLAVANASIHQLVLKGGPVDFNENGSEWGCLYDYNGADGSISGLAITPPKKMPAHMADIKNYIANHS